MKDINVVNKKASFHLVFIPEIEQFVLWLLRI